MTLSPFFRSPFTDITAGMTSHQMLDRCQKEEMKAMDCMEAYGVERGKVKCRDLLDDFHECHTHTKQFKRFCAMRDEREKQIREGTLTGDKKYVSPKVDSF
ncbi:NADH dehydrogenase iron-sulfur protein 5 [Eumeta japonica]|uniref:NADH dehydrogenase iron-sulfur protein 5 n=1 Tax=Eumeta variegata TaxID=151549 RepID=A0A4C1UMP7_EUMVA|nr:NADH dehydrogenase iron-sulfur protein 5 [Eumeta japonica]